MKKNFKNKKKNKKKFIFTYLQFEKMRYNILLRKK